MCAERHRNGFTLVEMLVAITILAVIAVLSWRGLDAVTRARAAVSDDIAAQRGLQAAYTQAEADLRFAARDPAPATSLPGVLLAAGEMIVLRQAPTVETGALRHQLVRYRLADGALRRATLTVTTPAELRQALAEPEWRGATEQVLTRGVAGFALRVWTPQGWAVPASELVAGLAAAQSLPVLMLAPRADPAGIEMRITLADGRQFTRALLVRD